MTENIEQKIVSIIRHKKAAKLADLQSETGFSRAYLNRFLKKLIQEKKIIRVGSTNRVRYLPFAPSRPLVGWTHNANNWVKELENKDLHEDLVFKQIKDETTILLGLPENTVRIVEYAFTEMLNNAIDHSSSKTIEVGVGRKDNSVMFWIRDRGIGIYQHVMEKRGLQSQYEAIQDILKGKQTTAPTLHSGEGIFFTSKIADQFRIISDRTELIVDNTISDLFINKHRKLKGTLVIFKVKGTTEKQLVHTFNQFAGGAEGKFDTTEIKVRLYTIDSNFVSRSQARRLLAGLDKFDRIILDFDRVESVGQGFADEIFRVFKQTHPEKKIESMNMSAEIEFMIKRVSG